MTRLNAQLSPGVLRSAAVGSRVLSPPYETAVPLQDFTAAEKSLLLGSVVYGTDQSILGRLGQLAVAVTRDPWVIPCLLLPPGEDVHGWLRDLVPMLGTRMAIVRVSSTTALASVGQIIDAVQRRPKPTASDLSTYVSMRLASPDLGSLLTPQFQEALGGESASSAHSLATYSRQFRKYGVLTARDWRAIARLAILLRRPSRLEGPGGRYRDPLSFAQGKTLHRHIRKYLGMSLSRARQLLGWEWIIERALLVAHYAADGSLHQNT